MLAVIVKSALLEVVIKICIDEGLHFMMNRMNYAGIENDHHHHYHVDHDDNLYWNAAALLPKVRRDPEQESPWPAFQPRSSGNQKVHADHQHLI